MSFNTRIKHKRDTSSNWESNNPVLLDGELIIVDTNAGDVRFKIGDGTKTYTQLPFQDEALYSVLSGKLGSDETAASATTLTGLTATVDELNYVDGVTSNIQSQLDSKLEAHPEISVNTDTTSTETIYLGGAFMVIDSILRDRNGHITAINTKTVNVMSDAALAVDCGSWDGSSDYEPPIDCGLW